MQDFPRAGSTTIETLVSENRKLRGRLDKMLFSLIGCGVVSVLAFVYAFAAFARPLPIPKPVKSPFQPLGSGNDQQLDGYLWCKGIAVLDELSDDDRPRLTLGRISGDSNAPGFGLRIYDASGKARVQMYQSRENDMVVSAVSTADGKQHFSVLSGDNYVVQVKTTRDIVSQKDGVLMEQVGEE